MNFEKLLRRNHQIEECLRSLRPHEEESLLTSSRSYRELVAVQERLLNAAERLADSLRHRG